MSSPAVRSFTEVALLNSFALDVICPPNCQKNKISQIGESIIQTLMDSKKNLYSNKIKEGYWHWGTKPIKAVLRSAYTVSVLLVMSPAGTFFNGSVTLIKLSQYLFTKYVGDGENQNEEWEKIKNYASAFFTDFTCTLIGVVIGGFVGALGVSSVLLLTSGKFLTLTVIEKISFLFIPCLIAGAAHFLGAYYPSYYLARLLGNDENKTGMYLALEARNQLGLVDQNGHLLKFSKKDKLEPKKEIVNSNVTYHFNDQRSIDLHDLLSSAELELLQCVRQAQKYLLDHNQCCISFAYPFNGKKVADFIEKQMENNLEGQSSTTLAARIPIHDIIDALRSLQFKVEAFKKLYYGTLEIMMKGSIGIELLQMMVHTNNQFRISKADCSIMHDEYLECFKTPYISPAYKNLIEFYESLEEDALNPDENQAPENVFSPEFFLYQLQINKWKVKNNVKSHVYSLLGLEKNFTELQKKTAFHKYDMALHPDKNNGSAKATALFQILQNVKLFIDAKLERNNKKINSHFSL